MFRLDYLSCFLTVVATILVGRRMWSGLVVSCVNSLIVCVIGLHTSQYGFIPANVFCICINAYNLRTWVRVASDSDASTESTESTESTASAAEVGTGLIAGCRRVRGSIQAARRRYRLAEESRPIEGTERTNIVWIDTHRPAYARVAARVSRR
jgi:hypothetical protein